MSTVPRPRTPSMTESRSTDGGIRGGPDDGSLPRVDRGAEEGLDPTVPARAPEQGGEVRVPDPARAARPLERVLRSQGGNPVSRVATPRGTGVRREPMAGADERLASEVLPADGPRPDRAPGGVGRLGRDDPGRGARPRRRPMTADDEYLGPVERALIGIAGPVLEHVFRDLRCRARASAGPDRGT